MSYFLSYSHSKNKIQVELDLFNYAKKVKKCNRC